MAQEDGVRCGERRRLAQLCERNLQRCPLPQHGGVGRVGRLEPRGAEARLVGFKGELRGYQKIGLGWLRFLDQMGWGGCLADDMGLGKTVQALAHLDLLKTEGREGPSIVVCPKSLIFNWLREIKKFTPHLKGVSYTGPKRTALLDKLDDYDIILTTYGTLRRDIDKLIEKSLMSSTS